MTKKPSRRVRRSLRRLHIKQLQYESMCKGGKSNEFTKPGCMKCW